MRNVIIGALVWIVIGWWSCMPYEEDTLTNIRVDYTDKALQELLDFKDKRQLDSLLPYLDAKDPTYRYVAALGFASAKDSMGLAALHDLLQDPVDEVRATAAFAIGQIGQPTSIPYLIEGFEQEDSLRQFTSANSQILEAVGKCGGLRELVILTRPKKYHSTDTLLMLGQSRGIYRMALRGITHPEGTKLMEKYAKEQSYPEDVRLMAANYLHRAKGIQVDSSLVSLGVDLRQEENPHIRMALVTALAKTRLPAATDSLMSLLRTEKDYRVQCNIIRSLSFSDYATVSPIIFAYLSDKNPHVRLTAADFFYQNGVPEDGKPYRNYARMAEDWRVKTRLYAAANKHLSYYYTQSKSKITQELIQLIKGTDNVYAKAAALDAMSEFEWTYPQMWELGVQSKEPILKSAGTRGLARILSSPRFNNVFGISKRRVGNEIRYYLTEALKSKDLGAMTEAANIMASPQADFATYYQKEGHAFLDTLLQEIPLPVGAEAYQALEKAIQIIEGKKEFTRSSVPHNNPIDWQLVENITSQSRAIIQTNKGKIILEFYPQKAPASCANFIRLAKDGYFNGKSIHRVVPNFVVQAGCTRGDGYSSDKMSIRTEIAKQYYDDEGYVGMASAGLDTESSQWFITHCPTPHLDGNYTLFAHVKDGMSVVHQLEVGDVIEQVAVKF